MMRATTRSTWSVARVGRAMLALDLALVCLLAVSLTGGSAIGAGRDPLDARRVPNPVVFLGQVFDQSGCTQAPLEDRTGALVVCRHFTAITDDAGRAQVVSLYGPGATAVKDYQGVMPQDLAWGQTLSSVMEQLGEPSHITDAWGTPTLVYMYDGLAYGSLELRFSGGDRLASINACLQH